MRIWAGARQAEAKIVVSIIKLFGVEGNNTDHRGSRDACIQQRSCTEMTATCGCMTLARRREGYSRDSTAETF